jgi:hypothetical protein
MSECIRLSERMPEVAQGRAEWTLAELDHLSECPGCRREWDLVQATSRLGEHLLEGWNSDELSRALLRRLKHIRAHAGRRRVWSLAGLAAAAAIAAILWSNRPERAAPLPATPRPGLEISLPELDGLQPAELDSVLRHMDDPLAADPLPEDGELTDLNSEELETVLDFWEG